MCLNRNLPQNFFFFVFIPKSHDMSNDAGTVYFSLKRFSIDTAFMTINESELLLKELIW